MTALTELNKEVVLCRECELSRTRTSVVPGEGAEDADIMFIGEAPGWHEDQQGRPFVGAAGKFLDELLASVNLSRETVYIANVIKCRPPSNRDPQPDEITACRKWLDRQIETIRPKMIVTLGRFSMGMFFPGKTISKIHGTSMNRDGVIYLAMYHPAAALHQQKLRQTILDDMQQIPTLLAGLQEIPESEPEPAESPATEPQQLKMFE